MTKPSIQKFMPPRKRRNVITPTNYDPDSSTFTTAGRKGYTFRTRADEFSDVLDIHLRRKYRGRSREMPKMFAAAVSKLANNQPMDDIAAYEWLLTDFEANGDGWELGRYATTIKEMRRGLKRARMAIEDQKIAAARRKAMLEAQKIPGAEFYQSLAWRQLRYQVLKERGDTCEACKRTMAQHGVAIHVDHILPRSEFPDLALEVTNLQVLCDDCNIGKGTGDTTDWRQLETQPVDE